MKLFCLTYVIICIFHIVTSQEKPAIKVRVNRAALEIVINQVTKNDAMRDPGQFVNLGDFNVVSNQGALFQSSYSLNNVVATSIQFSEDNEVSWDIGSPVQVTSNFTIEQLVLTGDWSYQFSVNGVNTLSNSSNFVAIATGIVITQESGTRVVNGQFSILPPRCWLQNDPIQVDFTTEFNPSILEQVFVPMLRSQIRDKLCISFAGREQNLNDMFFLGRPTKQVVQGHEDIIMDMSIVGDVTADEHGVVLLINGRMKPLHSPNFIFDNEPDDLPEFGPPIGEVQFLENGFHTSTLSRSYFLTGKASGNITQKEVPKHLEPLMNTIAAQKMMPGLERFGNRPMMMATNGDKEPIVTFDSDYFYAIQSLVMELFVIMDDGQLESAMTMSSDVTVSWNITTEGSRFFWRVVDVTGDVIQVSSNIGEVPKGSMNRMMSEQIGPTMGALWNEFLLKDGYELPPFIGDLGLGNMQYMRNNVKAEVNGMITNQRPN